MSQFRCTLLSFSGLLVVSQVGVARADGASEACSSAYAKGQQERLAGRLYTARSAFIECSAASCPDATASDCKRWTSEVEADLPTVRLRVVDAHGQPLAALRVFADGASISPAELASPIILEAGPHELRFEAPGYEPVLVEKALRPSDREVEVAVTMRRPAPPALDSKSARSSGVPTVSVVLAGGGAVALGGALYFGLKAHSQYQELKRDCAPLCSQAESDSLYSKAVISDVALVTGALALGASAWFYFSRGSASRPATAFALQPSPGGAQLGLLRSF